MTRKTPTDAIARGKGFYIMKKKSVCGLRQPDGRNIQFLYQDYGRMTSAAKIIGNVEDEEVLQLLATAEGFKKLVAGIGVRAEGEASDGTVKFALQFYGKTDPYVSGTTIYKDIPLTGAEEYIPLAGTEWTGDDNVPGQIRFEFPEAEMTAEVTVKLYLNEGFDAPEEVAERTIDFTTPEYERMITRSIMNYGNLSRIQKAMEDARNGKEVTIAFIGGSITQGAGAIPINEKCYARQSFYRFCDICGRGYDDNVKYVKAGVGGTPSEFGMIRYERDVLDYGRIKPDIVIVEYAVNDGDDETKGVCYESLVRRILMSENSPAVILPFEVFADDFNLQDRLAPVGFKYNLPMVSLKNAVMPEFYLTDRSKAVILKNEYFYDQYHPTNNGHIIAADGIAEIFKEADRIAKADISVKVNVKPAIGADYENIVLMDRKDSFKDAVIDAGDFTETDKELQAVERNYDLTVTPVMPNNWMHMSGDKPFVLDVKCKKLLVIFKDHSSPDFGTCELYDNGEKLITMDPHIVGWVHCHAVVAFNETETREHHLEIRVKSGDENKKFTILGFGIVG